MSVLVSDEMNWSLMTVKEALACPTFFIRQNWPNGITCIEHGKEAL